MKKRLLTLLLSLTLTASCLTACGDSSSTADVDNNSTKKAETWQETTTTTKKEEINEKIYDSSKFSIYYWGSDVHIVDDVNASYVKINLKFDNKTDNFTKLELGSIDSVNINNMSIRASIIGNVDKNSSEQAYIFIEGGDLKSSRINNDNLKDVSFSVDFQQNDISVNQNLKLTYGYKSVEETNTLTVNV